MQTFIIIIVVISIWVWGAIMATSKSRINKEGEIFEVFTSANSFGSISRNISVTAVLKQDCLFIYNNFHKEINVSLNYDKITAVTLTSNKEIIEKSKSVAGRAVLGGLVLGPIGAIAGGASGIGNKNTTKVHNYILINYVSKDGETEAIMLEVGLNAWDKFMKELQNRAGITKETSVTL